MFGERFYPLLAKLSPWKQSLFALALAQRQFANYWFWSNLSQADRGSAEYNFCLKKLWQYHQDKFNHVDLEEALAVFSPFAPDLEKEEDPEDPSTGTLLALDASLCLTAACDAVIMHEGNEAEIASRSSLAAAVLAAQQQSEEYLDEEALREHALVDNEVNFQVSLLELLIKAQRDPSLVQLILKTALKDGCSNIGISFDDKAGVEHDFDYYAIPLDVLRQAAKNGKTALTDELGKSKRQDGSGPYGKAGAIKVVARRKADLAGRGQRQAERGGRRRAGGSEGRSNEGHPAYHRH